MLEEGNVAERRVPSALLCARAAQGTRSPALQRVQHCCPPAVAKQKLLVLYLQGLSLLTKWDKTKKAGGLPTFRETLRN